MVDNQEKITNKLVSCLEEIIKIDNIENILSELNEGYYASSQKGNKLIYLNLRIINLAKTNKGEIKNGKTTTNINR